MEVWQSDTNSYRMRQRYKASLIQQGRDEAMRDFVSKSIQDTFTSTDPKMVERHRCFARLACNCHPYKGRWCR
jgi:hypothetical protein